MKKIWVLAYALAASSITQAQVAGAGSTLVKELMGNWISQYKNSGSVSYEAVGSSAGVAKAKEASVDFGISDVPLTHAALQQANLRQLPLAGAAVAVIVNLPELSGKPLKLTGEILADIYSGSITHWDHGMISNANPGLPLPNRAIVPIWRSDGSGQSYAFTNYLARNNSKWRRTVGTTSNLTAQAGKGVRGGSGMIEAVKNTPGALGYDNMGAAQAAGLVMAELRNAADRFVSPNAASINEALQKARWSPDCACADLDGSAGAATYPITTVSYALLPLARKGGTSALPFFAAAVANGDNLVRQNGLVPLPATAKAFVAQPN